MTRQHNIKPGTAGSPPRWRLALWGPPRLVPLDPCDANQTDLPLQGREWAWLALVAIDRSLSATRIAEIVWPGSDDPLNALQTGRKRLEKRFAHHAGEKGPLLSSLSPRPVLVGARYVGPDADTLRERAEAWSAPWLEGCEPASISADFDAWALRRQTEFAALWSDTVLPLAEDAENRGACAEALRLALLEPRVARVTERGARLRMRLHAFAGQASDAVAAFEALDRALRDRGARPSADTLELLRRIEAGQWQPPRASNHGVLPSLRRPPRLVGRQRELGALQRLLDRRRVPAIVGPAGIGKSRLIEGLAQRSGRALTVAARMNDAPVPFLLARRLLDVLDPSVGAVAEPVWRRTLEKALHDAVASGTTLIALDNLHFADAASLELLPQLIAALESTALRWVVAYRADEDDPTTAGAWAALRSLAGFPRLRTIGLTGLGVDGVFELLESLQLPGADAERLAPALHAHTAGRLFYLLETLIAAIARPGGLCAGASLPTPASIEVLLDRHLDRLSAPALDLVRLAAVAAPDLTPALAEQALATTAVQLCDPVAELKAAGILDELQFVHDLMQAAALRRVPVELQRRLHEIVARHLEETGAAAAPVARHWAAAACWEPAARWLRRASVDASRVGRLHEAADFTVRALEAARCIGDVDAALVDGLRAVFLIGFDQGGAAAVAFAEQLEVPARTRGQAARRGLIRGWALYVAGRYDDALAQAEAVLDEAESDDDAVRVDATSLRAGAAGYLRRAAEGAAWMAAVEAAVARLPDRDIRGRYQGTRATVALQNDRLEEARVATLGFLELARLDPSGDDELNALLNLSAIEMRGGRLDAALATSTRLRRLARERDQAEAVHRQNELYLGLIQTGLGHYRDAHGHLVQAVGEMRRHGAPARLVHVTVNGLAHVLIALGKYQGAAELLAEAPASPLDRAARCYARALLARAQGADDAAWLAEAVELSPTSSWDWVRLGAETALVRHRLTGAAAQQRYLALERQARSQGFMPEVVRAASERLAAAAADGSVGLLRADLEAHEHEARQFRNWTLYWPELLHRCAACWQALGDDERAAQRSDEAVAWVEQVAERDVREAWRSTFLGSQRQNVALLRTGRRPIGRAGTPAR